MSDKDEVNYYINDLRMMIQLTKSFSFFIPNFKSNLSSLFCGILQLISIAQNIGISNSSLPKVSKDSSLYFLH